MVSVLGWEADAWNKYKVGPSAFLIFPSKQFLWLRLTPPKKSHQRPTRQSPIQSFRTIKWKHSKFHLLFWVFSTDITSNSFNLSKQTACVCMAAAPRPGPGQSCQVTSCWNAPNISQTRISFVYLQFRNLIYTLLFCLAQQNAIVGEVNFEGKVNS